MKILEPTASQKSQISGFGLQKSQSGNPAVQCAVVLEVVPKNALSPALWRHVDGKAACIFENSIVAEKRGPLSSEKALNSKPTAATEPEV